MPLRRSTDAAAAGEPTRLPAADPDHPIGRLGLFVRAEDEADYVRSTWGDISARLRLIGLWGGGAFVVASAVDWTRLHGEALFWDLLLLRLAVFALGFNLWRVARAASPPAPGAARNALVLFELGVIVAFRLVNLAYGEYSPNQGFSGLLMALAFYAYVPMLGAANFWLLPLATFTLLVQSAWWYQVPLHELASLTVMAVFVHAMGWAAAVQSARTRRLAWLDARRLAREMRSRETAERNLQNLFEVCPVPLVLSTRDDGRILRFNEAAQALLDPGGVVSERSDVRASDFYADPLVRQRIAQTLRDTGQAGPQDVRMVNTEGGLLHVMFGARVLRYDGHEAVLSSLVEITERKRREQRLARLVQTDMLTGLFSRRGFFDRAETLLARPEEWPFSLLLVDADHFKRVNDNHGHAVGDAVLQQLANRMASVLREGDVVGRIGGEEFAVLLPGTALRPATVLAERIRQMVARHALRVHGARLPMSLSIGVTELRAGEQDIDAALSRADAAMYRAKQGGRNRVEVNAPA